MDAYVCVAVNSSPYCSAWQLVPVGCNAHRWQNSGRWWQLRQLPWFWDRERNSSRGLQMWSVIFIYFWGVCKKVNDGERVWIQVRGVKLWSNLWVLLAFGCFPVQCCANSAVGHFMLVRGSVCTSIPGSQRIGDCKSVQIEYSSRISCWWCPFVWSPSLCVCATFYLGVPCATESCIRNPKF